MAGVEYLCIVKNRVNVRIPYGWAILLLMAAFLLLPWLGETLFNSKGEPREAIVAVSMLRSGDWILPLSSGADMPYKPPVLAWMIAVFSLIFNGGEVTEYLSRLPSALAAIAMIMAGYSWARRSRGDMFALIFSLLTLTTFEVFRAAMACRVDMVLTAAMVWAMYLLFRIQGRPKDNNTRRWIGAWLLLGIAVLTKGPVGALLPCLVMGVYFLVRGEKFFKTFFKLLLLAVAAFAVAAPWYYAAYLRGGEGFIDLMMEENIGRLTGTMNYESHEQPFYYNFLTLIAGLLPWTLLVVFGLFKIKKVQASPLRPAGMLSLLALVLIVLFYCIPASKRSVYLLPAYPFAAYALTNILCADETALPRKIMAWLMSVLAVIVPVAFICLHFWHPASLPALHAHWYGYAMLSVPVLCGLAFLIRRRDYAVHSVLSVWALYLAYIACIMPAVLNPRSDKNLMDSIPAGTDTPVFTYQEGEPKYRLYTLNFYYNDRIRPIDNMNQADSLPAGSVIITPVTAQLRDSTGAYVHPDTCFRWYSLTDRSCDHRQPLLMGVRKHH